MKTAIVYPRIFSTAVSLLLCLVLFTNGCTTLETQKLVLEEPMNEDTEARVLRETGISGAVTGALIGAALVGVSTGLIVAARGGSAQQALVAGGIAAAAGGVAGGMVGYQQGKHQGQKIVAKSMERDQIQKLIAGARHYNARLARANQALKTRLSQVKQINDPKMRVREYNRLLKAAKEEETETSKRIALRQKALANPQWKNSDKPVYKSTLTTLSSETATLNTTIGQIEKAKQVASL